jgi:hypothetical protein
MNTPTITSKPSREEIVQAWEDQEAGRPVSADMRAVLDRLDRAVETGAQELKEEADYQKAIALAADYDSILEQLAVFPDRLLTRLSGKFPHVSRAAHGKRTRDQNKIWEEKRRAEMTTRFKNIAMDQDLSPKNLTDALLVSLRSK